MTEWIGIVQSVGFPVASLAFIGYGAIRITQWLAPRVDGLIDAHKGFLNCIAETQIEIKDCLRTLVERSQ